MICKIQRKEFEKRDLNFEKHVKNEHNIWNYFNFVSYMNKIDDHSCFGLEYDILGYIKKEDLRWIPFGRLLAFGEFI